LELAEQMGAYIRHIQWDFPGAFAGLDLADDKLTELLKRLGKISQDRGIEHSIKLWMQADQTGFISEIVNLFDCVQGFARLVRQIQWAWFVSTKPFEFGTASLKSLVKVMSSVDRHDVQFLGADARFPWSYSLALAHTPAHRIRRLAFAFSSFPLGCKLQSLVAECTQLSDLDVHQSQACQFTRLVPPEVRSRDGACLQSCGPVPPLRTLKLTIHCGSQTLCDCGYWCRWIAMQHTAVPLVSLHLDGVNMQLIPAVLRQCCTTLRVFKLKRKPIFTWQDEILTSYVDDSSRRRSHSQRSRGPITLHSTLGGSNQFCR
jgi:hypothetical protein